MSASGRFDENFIYFENIDGTVLAALDLIRKFQDKKIVGAGFIINLPELGGEEKMRQFGIKTKYLIEF